MGEKEKSAAKAPFFSEKRKGIAAVISVCIALIWALLSSMMPMEFYSLFFISEAGSTFLLAMLAAVITFPEVFISSKVLKTDINVPAVLIVNIIGMVGSIFIYSVYRYDALWLLILSLVLHAELTILFFLRSPAYKISKIKSPTGNTQLLLGGLVSSILSDMIFFILFNALISYFTSEISTGYLHY